MKLIKEALNALFSYFCTAIWWILSFQFSAGQYNIWNTLGALIYTHFASWRKKIICQIKTIVSCITANLPNYSLNSSYLNRMLYKSICIAVEFAVIAVRKYTWRCEWIFLTLVFLFVADWRKHLWVWDTLKTGVQTPVEVLRRASRLFQTGPGDSSLYRKFVRPWLQIPLQVSAKKANTKI